MDDDYTRAINAEKSRRKKEHLSLFAFCVLVGFTAEQTGRIGGYILAAVSVIVVVGFLTYQKVKRARRITTALRD